MEPTSVDAASVDAATSTAGGHLGSEDGNATGDGGAGAMMVFCGGAEVVVGVNVAGGGGGLNAEVTGVVGVGGTGRTVGSGVSPWFVRCGDCANVSQAPAAVHSPSVMSIRS